MTLTLRGFAQPGHAHRGALLASRGPAEMRLWRSGAAGWTARGPAATGGATVFAAKPDTVHPAAADPAPGRPDARACHPVAGVGAVRVSGSADTGRSGPAVSPHRSGNPAFMRGDADRAPMVRAVSGNRRSTAPGTTVATGRARFAALDPATGDLLQIPGTSGIGPVPTSAACCPGRRGHPAGTLAAPPSPQGRRGARPDFRGNRRMDLTGTTPSTETLP